MENANVPRTNPEPSAGDREVSGVAAADTGDRNGPGADGRHLDVAGQGAMSLDRDTCAECGGDFRGHGKDGPYQHRFLAPTAPRAAELLARGQV